MDNSRELRAFANALIVAFECKKPMRSRAFKAKDWGVISGHIREYLTIKNDLEKLGILEIEKLLSERYDQVEVMAS